MLCSVMLCCAQELPEAQRPHILKRGNSQWARTPFEPGHEGPHLDSRHDHHRKSTDQVVGDPVVRSVSPTTPPVAPPERLRSQVR